MFQVLILFLVFQGRELLLQEVQGGEVEEEVEVEEEEGQLWLDPNIRKEHQVQGQAEMLGCCVTFVNNTFIQRTIWITWNVIDQWTVSVAKQSTGTVLELMDVNE